MKVLLATDAHIYVCKERYYYATQVSTIVRRYRDVFGKLIICGRVIYIEQVLPTYEDITEVVEDVVDISSLGKVMIGRYNRTINEVVSKCDFVICRCHGIISSRVAEIARKHRKPYFAEIMGCAWDAYWNHGFVGKLIAPYMFLKMKRVVKNADYALYVTSEFLQKRYPCKRESVSASNVLIQDIREDTLQRRLEKIEVMDRTTLTLMTTAAVDVKYKGQEYVIKAIPLLNEMRIKVNYLLVGGGNPQYLQKVVKACGVEEQVKFVGRCSLAKVFELLDQTDIYIQPSLQEGLPRSVIEAMSRACPVIGAKTAGIPELISRDCVVRRKSARDIARTVQKISDKKYMLELAQSNFENSKLYLDSVLNERRSKYYQRIKEESVLNDK